MKILLDTHILLWWLDNNPKLSDEATLLISNSDNDIYVSYVSLWEIQIKIGIGKLQADLKMILEQLPKNNFQELGSHSSHILALSKLPLHHKDPFDRMLIAQAIQQNLTLMTHDKTVSDYDKSIMFV